MSEKTRIGDREYRPPFTVTFKYIADSDGVDMSLTDIRSALNELASLRAENSALKARIVGYVLGHKNLADVLRKEAARLRGNVGRFEIDQCICVLEGRATLLTNTVHTSKEHPDAKD